jgi:hypothetical protein
MDEAAPQAAASGTADEDALEALRWDWGEAYEIGRDGERGWHARRRDGLGGDLTGADAEELREVIRSDYTHRRVPRDLGARGDEP